MAVLVIRYSVVRKGFSRDTITEFLKYNIPYKQNFINLYGGVQKTAGKRAIENFTIFKNAYGKLEMPLDEMDPEVISEKIKEISPIFQYCEEQGIPAVYVTSILPVQDEDDLPYGRQDGSFQNAKKHLEKLNEMGIHVCHLREDTGIKRIPKEELFYKTDHHWAQITCFISYLAIMMELGEKFGIPVDSDMLDIGRYTCLGWKESFLGSYGVKVGEYYAGKDDFVVYVPDFPTRFSFESYAGNGVRILSKEGEWIPCLMNEEILRNPDYDNKYNAWLNTCYIESRIVNQLTKSNLKLLYISHSYGRPMAQYLALQFKEVRYLDPQEGRFRGNYLDYIEEYKPNIVVVQAEYEGQLIGNYLTEKSGY